MLRKGTVMQDINFKVASDSDKNFFFFCYDRAGIFNLIKRAQESIPPAYVACAGILEQSMWLVTE